MKIIDTNDTTYFVELIPRTYTLSISLDFELYDESEKETESISSEMFSVINGVLTWEFLPAEFSNISFTEDGTYQLKISDGTYTVYRGKLLVTSQTTQDFKLTDGLYTYN